MVEQIARWGKEFIVGTGVATTAPSVAALGVTGSQTGRFVIVYAQGTTDVAGVGDTEGIVGQLFNSDGSKNGGAFLVNSTTEAIQIGPSIVDRVDDQGFAVAWADNSSVNEGLGTDVRMRLFDVNATPAANDFIVHAAEPMFNNESNPSIDRIGTFGTIFVGYDDLDTPQLVGDGNLNTGVRGRAFSNATPLQSEFWVTNSDPHGTENSFQAQVDVADLPSTGFLVTWVDNLAGGVSFDFGTAIRGRIYSQLGVQIGSEFNIATNANTVLNHPASIGLQNGVFAVAWTQDDDPTSGGFDRNIYARVFPSGSASGGTPFLLGSTPADQQDNVVLAAFGPDKFIAAWSQQLLTDYSVHARIFDSTGTPWSEEFVVNSAQTHTEALPSIAVLQEATGPRFVISWRDQTSSAIEGQIFTTDGATGGFGIDFYGSDANETYAAQYDEHTLWGNGGADNLTGSATADTFKGGTGNDTLNGGGGNDTAVFSGPREDFRTQTKIVGGTSTTIIVDEVGSGGTDTTTGIEQLQYTGGTIVNHGAQANLTMNVDGHRFDDVVFRSVSSGQIIYQNMSAGATAGFDAVTNPLPGWTAVGTGDVSGDGKADVIIWNSANGFVYSALPGASASPSYGLLAGGINGTYSALGVTDINGDGFNDLLVREANSGTIYWRDTASSAWAYVGINLGSNWNYQAAGDVNRDGFSDVVIRDTSGLVYIANMANGVNSGYTSLGNLTGYQVRTVADVNADGFADVIVQRESDGWTLWRDLSGGTPWNVATNPVGTSWIVKDAADVDNDGSADLVFQHSTTGETLYRAMDAGVGTSWQVVSSPLGTEWVVV